jgi:hypothetical protein
MPNFPAFAFSERNDPLFPVITAAGTIGWLGGLILVAVVTYFEQLVTPYQTLASVHCWTAMWR